MVILYGHMSKCETLPRHTALEDVWLALDMLPRFRWRWERKDFAGGHPLIAKLAERVMDVNLQQVGPVSHPCLLCEPEWDEDIVMSPIPTSTSAPTSAPASVVAKSQQSTPTLSHSPYALGPAGGVVYGPHPRPMNGGQVQKGAKNVSGGSTPSDSQLVDVPAQLFYPFYPEQVESMSMPQSAQNGGPVNASNNRSANTDGSGSGASGNVVGNGITGGGGNGDEHQRDYSVLLVAAAAAQDNMFGY